MFIVLLNKSVPVDFGVDADQINYKNAQDATNQINDLGTILNGYGSSGIRLATTILIYVVAIGFVVAAIKMIKDSGDPEKLSESKSAFMYKFLAAVLGFGAVGLAIMAWNVGQGLL